MILVTGATGTTGGATLRELVKSGHIAGRRRVARGRRGHRRRRREVLTEPGHEGAAYTPTGPEPLSDDEIATRAAFER